MEADKITIAIRNQLLSAISAHMVANNITQEAAAEKIGWQQQTVQRMLSGKFGPKLDHLLMLCQAVGVRLDVRSTLYKIGEE